MKQAMKQAMGRIITVTPNPAVDLSYHVAGITPGASHRVAAPLSRAGGKGLNVARVAHQLGHPVLALAPSGGTAGAEFAAELRSSGVPHRLIPVAAETRRSIAFVDTVGGETSIFNEEGSPLQPSEWQALAAAVVDALDGQSAGVLVGSGSLPPARRPTSTRRWCVSRTTPGFPPSSIPPVPGSSPPHGPGRTSSSPTITNSSKQRGKAAWTLQQGD